MLIWQAHKSKIESVAFSPDGQLLATATGGVHVPYFWEPTSGKFVRKLQGSRGPIKSIGFAPHAPLLATGAAQSIRLWRTDTWEVCSELAFTYACDLAFGAGGAPMLAAGGTYGVRFWADVGATSDSRPRSPDATYPTLFGNAALDFSPDGALLAASTSAAAEIYRTATRERVWTLRGAPSNNHGAVRFAPDGKRIAISYGKWVEVWALAGEPERLVKIPAGIGRAARIWVVHWTADGASLLTAGNEGTVRMWDPASGAEQRTFNWNIGKLYGAAFSPDGLTCAACGEKGQVVVWDVDA